MNMVTTFPLFIIFLFFPSLNALNYRAVIGILTRDIVMRHIENKTSELEAGYIKSLEASGARIVPIEINQSRGYYEHVLKKINGVLLPGGYDGLEYKGYVKTAKILYDMIVEMNDKNDYFPLFGIDLGFEVLSSLASPKTTLQNCDAMNLAAFLCFEKGAEKSRMYRNLNPNLKKIMEGEPVTFHFHNKCLTPKGFAKASLNKSFKILTHSRDLNNDSIVSSIEGIKYPFYGIMFHPEVAQFNFVVSDHIANVPHSLGAIETAQYFSNFFVDEARKNTHQFPNLEIEDNMLIYNYNPVFTGKYGSGFLFEQMFFF